MKTTAGTGGGDLKDVQEVASEANPLYNGHKVIEAVKKASRWGSQAALDWRLRLWLT